jgi:hypothetical protein
MSFLYPAFLWSLAVLGIPIIIHLFNFRRYKKIQFTNVRFLQELKEETQSKQKLKHLLILLARCLALAALVFAFAQPYFRKEQQAEAGSDNVISIYIDNSYSMGAKGVEGELLEQAKGKARDIAQFFRSSDLFQLITNDFEGRHQRLVTREEFLKLVDEVKLTPNSHSISEVLNRQKECVNNARGNKQVYWLSDFQVAGTDLSNITYDSTLSIQAYNLQPNQQQNIYIDSCWFESPYVALNETNKLMVRIQNASSTDAENGSLNLRLNEVQKAIASYNVSRNSNTVVEMNVSIGNAGWNSGELSITDNPITFDDNLFFTFFVDALIPVLSINDKDVNPYIKAVYESNPYFNVKQVSARNINYDALRDFKLIILNEVGEVSSGLQQQLKLYVDKGGSLLLVPNSAVKKVNPDYNLFLQAMQVNGFDGIETAKQPVTEINLQHPVFADVFEMKQGNMDLPEALKSYILNKAIVPGQEVLMKLKNGNPFFCKYTVGSGYVYLSASPFNAEWSSLPRHALFVPLMYKIALLGNKQLPLYQVIGRDKMVALKQQIRSAEEVLILKSNTDEIIPEVVSRQSGNLLYVPYLGYSGIYNLQPRTSGDTIYQKVAFNYSRTESSLKYFTGNELGSAFAAHSIHYLNAVSSVTEKAIAETQYRNSLWKWFVMLALLFLGLEIILIRFYNPTHKAQIVQT